ncbi:hypothetical protein C8J35_1296 [Rhizobium sp. PP-F2F-G38]|nr:hypothetical protein C8J35_1296 [Rhizobium sp. PP-F2F-G38]
MADEEFCSLAPEHAALLESCAERIATIDPRSTFGLIDIGEVLWTASEEVGEDVIDRWAVEQCRLTADQRLSASHAYFTLGPHRRRLEHMDVSEDLLRLLLEGQDEDVDHGVDALETYGLIPVADLAILMDVEEQKVDVSPSHALLRFDLAAMEELITMKARNGMVVFQRTLTCIGALISRLEAVGFEHADSEQLRLDLQTRAEEVIALFENLALLPHRRLNAPDVLHASWPPEASAWTQLDEAMIKLRFLEERDIDDLASIRVMMMQLVGVSNTEQNPWR